MDTYIKDFDGWHPCKTWINQSKTRPTIRQREIWWCSIGVNVGVEQDGKNSLYERPVLIVRKFNHRHFLGTPLTTQIKDLPWRHTIYYRNKAEGRTREGQAILSQLRAYDTARLTRHLARLGNTQFNALVQTIQEMLSTE